MKKKYAVFSVSNKENLDKLAMQVIEYGYEILSTGGTLNYLKSKNIKVKKIENYIKFPEILDGRVKTLHPKIHGGLLGDVKNQDHLKEMKTHKIYPIGMVVINLYQFKETISNHEHTLVDAIENIDIGGPSMLRSAAKNFKNVVVLTNPDDYQSIIDEMIENRGKISLLTRKNLAAKVFSLTAEYDKNIANYFENIKVEKNKLIKPENLKFPETIELNYGENPHQSATIIKNNTNLDSLSIIYGEQLQGKKISFNNVNDGDSAIKLLNELDLHYKNCCVAIKHMNSCGVGVDLDSPYNSWRKCYEGDQISIFGGVIACNFEINEKISQEMNQIFLEIIIAPSFTKEALEIFSSKKNLRLIKFSVKDKKNEPLSQRTINGGMIIHSNPKYINNTDEWILKSKNKDVEKYIDDLKLSYIIVKYLKSNAICIVQDGKLLGIGVGQTNRVLSVKLAINQNRYAIKNAVLASDAFFPMVDSIEEIAKVPIKAIVQPGGSINDSDVIETVDKNRLIMYFTNERFFIH
ncbi:MAG: bifunctional phosphoribosylaminoimidazolecarboxamide formyltransferase/IMP cyclohydrolase [Mycoplasmoidaceae bacterium]